MENNYSEKDITGMKFNKLTALKRVYDGRKGVRYLFRCDCGNYSEVLTNRLISGHTKSCGCLVKEKAAKASTTHGKSKTRIYRIYNGMKQRCYNESAPSYVNYGSRGIKICDEWLKDFTSFYNWALENGYSEELSIDRIDNNGNYEPSNCRWTTQKVQANNRRTSHYIDVNGEKITLAAFLKRYDIKSRAFVTRRLIKGYDYKKILEDYKRSREGK